jgi:hypothetical protein
VRSQIFLSILFISIGSLLFNGFPKFSGAVNELISVHPGDRIDLGQLEPDTPHKVVFSLESKSLAPVILAEIRTECMCTVAEIPEERVLGNQQPYQIVVHWTPSANQGVQRQHVVIQYLCNQVLYSKVLTLIGEVPTTSSEGIGTQKL